MHITSKIDQLHCARKCPMQKFATSSSYDFNFFSISSHSQGTHNFSGTVTASCVVPPPLRINVILHILFLLHPASQRQVRDMMLSVGCEKFSLHFSSSAASRWVSVSALPITLTFAASLKILFY